MGRKADLLFTLNCSVYTKELLCEKGKEQTFITGLWCAEYSTELFRGASATRPSQKPLVLAEQRLFKPENQGIGRASVSLLTAVTNI